jgi:hypothetical protein
MMDIEITMKMGPFDPALSKKHTVHAVRSNVKTKLDILQPAGEVFFGCKVGVFGAKVM